MSALRQTVFDKYLGPQADLTLVVRDMFITEIRVGNRRPHITIRDYDWGETDTAPERDVFGCPYTPITWRGPIWKMGLSLHPPEKDTYTMANQTLRTIPLTDLKVSNLNMRHGRKKPDISDILPSIRQHGLRQTLLVRKEGKHFGVVAGRRRLFALKQVAKETGIAMKVPCVVMKAGDDAAAMEASIIENAARLPATEMEQYVAFGRLAEEGRSVTEIAEYFGVTEMTVKRVLALAALAEPIRKLYAADGIDRETIRALTLATPDQQAEWLRFFDSDEDRAPWGRSCKAWVTGGQTITTDKALFDLDDYDGQVVADLFGDAGVFASADEFWAAQSTAIAAQVQTYRAAGWSDVCVMERGKYYESWSYTKRPRTKGGKVFVEIRHDGTVLFHEGLVTDAEARRLEKAKRGESDAPKAIKPEMTKAMGDYISQHRYGAARASLLGHPAIALRLMVAHALIGSDLWRVNSHSYYTQKEDVMASLEGSRATAEMDAAEEAVLALFQAHGIPALRRYGQETELCRIFAALLGMDDSEVLQVLTYTMADTLEAGGAVVEAVAAATETDMAAYWTPEPVFFELLRDKRVINAMLGELGGDALAASSLTETGKVQKQMMGARISGDGCEARGDWRPRWMQLPPARYVEGAGSGPADAWGEVAEVFGGPEPDKHTVATDAASVKAA